MMRRLSIVCVTRLEPFSQRFLHHMSLLALATDAELVIGVDQRDECYRDVPKDLAISPLVISVKSKGYVESVLDNIFAYCVGEYVLRLDDDETCSQAMIDWLIAEEYRAKPNWKFCTANLWRDEKSFLYLLPLWPDHHTRLSRREFAGGRSTPHAGSPHGGGELAPVIHLHHKFLVKTFEERLEVAKRYDAYADGFGTGDGLRPFSLPETCYDRFFLAPVGVGQLREFQPWEIESIPNEKRSLSYV